MVRFEMSSAVSVTRRNCSDCWPTKPTTQMSGPLDRTVSTLIGSLNNGPFRICSSRMTVSALTENSLFSAIITLAPISGVHLRNFRLGV